MAIQRYPILNIVNALIDFRNLLASKTTSFHYGDCTSECAMNFIKFIKDSIDKSAVI